MKLDLTGKGYFSLRPRSNIEDVNFTFLYKGSNFHHIHDET